MPRPHPPEFRRRAVEFARLREMPVEEMCPNPRRTGRTLNWSVRHRRYRVTQPTGTCYAERTFYVDDRVPGAIV
jgi:hypothetical protein